MSLNVHWERAQNPFDWDRIFDPLRFEELIDLGTNKAHVRPEIDARNLALISRHERLQHSIPFVGVL
jgi:hypothetical protein